MKLLSAKIKHLILLIILPILFSSYSGFSQDQVGVYFCGMTMHLLGDKNASLMPLRLDEKGQFVINIGGALQYRKKLSSRWSLDAVQTFQADCAFKGSWGTGISIGYDLIKSSKHQFIFAIGPGFFFRNSWFEIDGYLPVEELKVSANKNWEYLFAPIVPHVEYAYFPKNKNLGISAYCIFDPINVLGNVGFGVNYKIPPNPLKGEQQPIH